MDGTRQLSPGLGWSQSDDRVTITGREGRPFLYLRVRADRMQFRVVRVDGPGIEITRQPAAVAALVRAHCDGGAAAAELWERSLTDALRHLAHATGLASSSTASLGLTGLVGALGYPLLRHAYDNDAGPLVDIPAWAAPILSKPSAVLAASTAFPGRTNRRLTRALASGVVPPPSSPAPTDAALGPLALALAGNRVLNADQLANILEHRDPHQPAAGWPTVDDLATTRRLLAGFPPERVARLLLDAAATAPLNDFFATIRLLGDAAPMLARPLPQRVGVLREACLALVPHDPAPADTDRSRARPTQRPRAEARTTARPVAVRAFRHVCVNVQPEPAPTRLTVQPEARATGPGPLPNNPFAPHRPLRPPPPSGPAPRTAPTKAFDHPPCLREMHGHLVANLRLVLPRTPTELATWGRLLHNCLAAYTPAIRAGSSWIIGVEHNNLLHAAAEISPTTRTIRQFVADRNRRPRPDHTDTVINELRRLGLLRTSQAIHHQRV